MGRIKDALAEDDTEAYETWKANNRLHIWDIEYFLDRVREGNVAAGKALIAEAIFRLRQIEYRYHHTGPTDNIFDLPGPLAAWLATVLERLDDDHPRHHKRRLRPIRRRRQSLSAALLVPRPNGGRRPAHTNDLRRAGDIGHFRWQVYKRVRDQLSVHGNVGAAAFAAWKEMVAENFVHPTTKRPPAAKTVEKWFYAHQREERQRVKNVLTEMDTRSGK